MGQNTAFRSPAWVHSQEEKPGASQVMGEAEGQELREITRLHG
jgi:hypothetical protein